MAKKKTKTAYFCQNCGHESAKWMGKCSSCEEWNTYVEEVIETAADKNDVKKLWQSDTTRRAANKPKRLAEIEKTDFARISTHDGELNRVLGGGLVQGSLVLIGGEPGIGKSTLMLQVALALKDHVVLYVSGEESEQQIKMRAERLEAYSENCLVLNETNTQNKTDSVSVNKV